MEIKIERALKSKINSVDFSNLGFGNFFYRSYVCM